MRIFAVLGMIAASGAAMAECPTRADMEDGATALVTYPDGGVVGLRWLGAGMVEETTRYPDGVNEFRMISMGGVFIVDEVDLNGDMEIAESRIVTRYPPDLYERLPIEPGSEMSVTGTNSFADGSAPEDEHIVLRAGDEAEIDIAGCTYRGFPMLISYDWEGDHFVSMMTYLPDLGVSLEIARMDEGSRPLPFSPESISLERP